jgi:hypothetical protein
LIQNGRIAAESTPPQAVAHHEHAGASGLILLSSEGSPQDRIGPEQAKVISRRSHRRHGFWSVAAIQIHATAGQVSRQILEAGIVLFPVREHRYSSGVAARTPDVYDAIRVRKGQGAKDHRIHHGKDRCVRRNAYGKCGHGGDCEAGTLSQDAKRVSEITQEGFHCTGAPSMKYKRASWLLLFFGRDALT